MTKDIPAPLRALLGYAGLLLVWQAVVTTHWVPEEYLPGVPAIVGAVAGQLASTEFWHAELLSMARAIGGLALAAVTGIGAALLGARYRWVERALAPLVQVALALPPAALVPLSIFALGLGWSLFAFIIWYAGVWVIYLGAEHALRVSEPVQLHMARVLGYDGWETLWRVRLPAAAPAIFTGLRIAAAGSLMATVAAEMLAGKDGLGFLLYDTAFSLQIPQMFALLTAAGFNGLLLNLAIVRLRRRLAGWHDELAALQAN